LLEILVALMILMIGLTTVILVFAQGVSLQARSRHDMDSARMAQSVISEIQFLADEYNRLPDEGRISSHAGFPDRYDVKIDIEEMDTHPDDVTGAIEYTNQPHRVSVTVITTFRGSEQKDTYNTAVVVSN
jgi:Tfp pilus assembly protein PilV